jgi:hypothetical protein
MAGPDNIPAQRPLPEATPQPTPTATPGRGTNTESDPQPTPAGASKVTPQQVAADMKEMDTKANQAILAGAQKANLQPPTLNNHFDRVQAAVTIYKALAKSNPDEAANFLKAMGDAGAKFAVNFGLSRPPADSKGPSVALNADKFKGLDALYQQGQKDLHTGFSKLQAEAKAKTTGDQPAPGETSNGAGAPADGKAATEAFLQKVNANGDQQVSAKELTEAAAGGKLDPTEKELASALVNKLMGSNPKQQDAAAAAISVDELKQLLPPIFAKATQTQQTPSGQANGADPGSTATGQLNSDGQTSGPEAGVTQMLSQVAQLDKKGAPEMLSPQDVAMARDFIKQPSSGYSADEQQQQLAVLNAAEKALGGKEMPVKELVPKVLQSLGVGSTPTAAQPEPPAAKPGDQVGAGSPQTKPANAEEARAKLKQGLQQLAALDGKGDAVSNADMEKIPDTKNLPPESRALLEKVSKLVKANGSMTVNELVAQLMPSSGTAGDPTATTIRPGGAPR